MDVFQTFIHLFFGYYHDSVLINGNFVLTHFNDVGKGLVRFDAFQKSETYCPIGFGARYIFLIHPLNIAKTAFSFLEIVIDDIFAWQAQGGGGGNPWKVFFLGVIGYSINLNGLMLADDFIVKATGNSIHFDLARGIKTPQHKKQ